MKKTRNISFIVELLLLFVILLFVIVIITKTFVTARGMSEHARSLNEAVCIARDVAEVSMSASDPNAAAEAFEKMDQVEGVILEGDEKGTVLLHVDVIRDENSSRRYLVFVNFEETPSAEGSFTAETIEVRLPGTGDAPGETVYTLEAGAYHRKGDV